MRGCELLKRKELKNESLSPFHSLVEDTLKNSTKNVAVFYNSKGARIIVRPGFTETFKHYIERPLGKRKIRSKQPGTDYWEEKGE